MERELELCGSWLGSGCEEPSPGGDGPFPGKKEERSSCADPEGWHSCLSPGRPDLEGRSLQEAGTRQKRSKPAGGAGAAEIQYQGHQGACLALPATGMETTLKQHMSIALAPHLRLNHGGYSLGGPGQGYSA